MKVLITGICGFVGNALARRIKAAKPAADVFGVDNLMRLGSEANRRLARHGIRVYHGDLRCASDVDALPAAYWVIDAAANPSVLAGFDSRSSTRQLIEHNLFGTVNLLEYCRRHGAGFILLGTSRVYAIRPLAQLPLEEDGRRFVPRFPEISFAGFSHAGIADGKERPFDIPWAVLDSRRATAVWGWELSRPIASILTEIACHAEENPDWLELTDA